MGILGKITDKFSSTSIKDKNSNTFMHLQKQSESIHIDTEVLVRSSETYLKLFNKKSKAPQNLVNQGSSKNSKKFPLELMSLAALQASQTLNNTCHLSRVYNDYSDAHRHMYEKQKDMAEALNKYIQYLNESLDDFKKYQTSKNLYAKNAKNFVSYQNKLKKQNQPVSQEQKSKVELLYKNYQQSLTTLAEKMADLTSNRKEAERTQQFVNLIDSELSFYQNAVDELLQLKQSIKRSNEICGEDRYSEKKSEKDYINEIVDNKLELEDFKVAQTVNGATAKITHQNSDSALSKNSLSSKENSYQNLGLMDYNGNNFNYDYSVDGYYNDQYINDKVENNNNVNEQNIVAGTSMYNNNITSNVSNPVPIDNSPSPFDNYLNPSNIKNTVEATAATSNIKTSTTKDQGKKKDRSSIFSDDYSLGSPSGTVQSSGSAKRKSIINNENLTNLTPNEKVYNTKELDSKYCKAIYPFEKSMDDELELQTNDLVDITKMFDDGWATGVNLRSGKDGFFPLNCLLEFYVTDKFADFGGSKENSESYVYSSNN
ncbi:hypothetical protein BCR36DRAFT_396242 [Piromyces finnis]|uniref:SH3 domain-containing protein n=1 Tax=Piromyces finnis TaxID=1754191 RepID=A0A1Y1VHC2_9FUNG|nr:hypothetical protein BCR36DRAFT_396242 [Piromyces finnis]|eukprot:ORX54860.1 hypothetical protein BCR36DRAFT_396242 [Piromyces finnis]